MDELEDDRILRCPRSDFYLLCEAITEYNKTEDAEEDYYIITSDFTINALYCC